MSYARDHLIPLVDEALGNSAYLADLGFVLADGQDPAEVAWQALKIGYEDLAGQLDGGMAAWLLQRGGHCGLAVLAGGAPDWAAATGASLREGA